MTDLYFQCDTCDNRISSEQEQVPNASLLKHAEILGWMCYTRRTFYCPECVWKRENPGVEWFKDTGLELTDKLNEVIGLRCDDVTAGQMNRIIYDVFNGAVARRAILLAAEGMQVVGARPDNDLGKVPEQRAFVLEYQTQFHPSPRFTEDLPDKYVALGFYKDYQLYLVPQEGLPSTIVARYGPGGEYLTYNPGLQGLSKISIAGEHFAVALQRLLFWRCDFEGWVAAERSRLGL
jgi:hypothetical protein